MANIKRLVAAFEEERALRAWLDANATECPGCAAWVNKSEGCSHMTCSKCGSHFCYRCGQSLRPSDPYKHYNTPGGRCYGKLFDFAPGGEPTSGSGLASFFRRMSWRDWRDGRARCGGLTGTDSHTSGRSRRRRGSGREKRRIEDGRDAVVRYAGLVILSQGSIPSSSLLLHCHHTRIFTRAHVCAATKKRDRSDAAPYGHHGSFASVRPDAPGAAGSGLPPALLLLALLSRCPPPCPAASCWPPLR